MNLTDANDLGRQRRSILVAIFLFLPMALHGEPVSLQALVTPSTIIMKDGQPVRFAVHGFVEFKSLAELFLYIDSQASRWKGSPNLDAAARQDLGRDLLRHGIESRVISMADERPLETLITHTREELLQALTRVKEPMPQGYAEDFLSVQEKWKHSLNCWSAAPSIPARALSNWYPIEEGIQLYGATYDSTEHFWQAVKYHPDVTVGEIRKVLREMKNREWGPWLARLDNDSALYLPNTYAVEFLRHNLTQERLHWFDEELTRQGVHDSDHARTIQQRESVAFRFSAYEEKVLWGDLVDLFQLVFVFSLPNDPARKTLETDHFDGVYLGTKKIGFISEDFRALMLEIWKVKYLQMPRFGEVIRSIPSEIKLSHFLNDGDSPDIPIPIYVEYLNQIREIARAAK